MTIAPCIVGIDVSKQWLDCFFHPAGRRCRFANDAQGHDGLVALLATQESFCVLEATGPYDRSLCLRLHDESQPFHRANPRKARQFAKAAGFLAKTDRVDACMLARYGAAMSLPAEARPQPARQALRDLMARRDQLVEMRKGERTRLAQPHADWLEESLRQMIDALDRQIEAVEARIDALMASSRRLLAQKALLCSAPGVGPVTAKVLLAHMPELGHRDRRAIGALAGLAPLSCDSGAMHGRRCIWGGRKRVRDALYMAALAACRCAPFKAVSQAMRDRGKPAKLVIIAIARRLLVALNALLRDNRTFQP
ncbi:IS110 family transposase [Rhizobiaceae bacterium BDR2-2]|uniref:IS110 family transposase n=1 Tax=Ectorhizobium quercum TaxID=2965071 RepID=A0AAE3N533_9HYPH|nr:IS110 family transposase [Ectorhizobium quercum]MCX9000047.1 IS110 family transposase [Ectorhizobium quercum]